MLATEYTMTHMHCNLLYSFKL